MHCRFFVAAALFSAACSGNAAVIYGQNLVVNGDAEAGMSGWTGYAGYSMFQSVNYGNNWVLPTQPGPLDRGASMFAGQGQHAVGYQSLDFSAPMTHPMSYSLSGWLGGWASQGDNAVFYVQFLDAFDNEIGSSALGPVSADDRGNRTGLFYRASGGFVPAGTSKLSFWLSMERLVSSDNDGYAHNLAFVLKAPVNEVPEPAMAPVFLLGFGVMAWARRRKSVISVAPFR
jgi:hypothetical protein